MQVGHSPRLWGRQPLTHAFLQACLSVHPSVCHGNSRQTCHIHKLCCPQGNVCLRSRAFAKHFFW